MLLAPAAAEIFGGRYSGEIYRRLWLTVPLANFVGTTIMSKARDAAYTRHATSLAADVIDAVGRPELKLMFDCYHVARNGEDVIARFEELLPLIGHVQFAGLPDRGEPDRGTLDYGEVFAAIADANWDRPLGAEYRPAGRTEASLGWMSAL